MVDQALNILIVEDNAALAANIYDLLEACGHQPDAAADDESALGLVALHLKSGIPVLLLTSKDQLENKIRASGAKLLQTVTGSGYRLGAEHG